MKMLLLLFIGSLMLLALNTSAQEGNLVENPGFEKQVILKEGFPWPQSWREAYRSTPDYFSRTNTNGEPYNIDNTIMGYNEPHSGDSYMGIGIIGNSTYIEQIVSKLKEPLQVGKTYRLSFYASVPLKFSDYFTNYIGMYLSEKDEIQHNYLASVYYNMMNRKYVPQLRSENYLTDTGWTKIEGIYTAKGGEQYVYIGMFWVDDPEVIKRNVIASKNSLNNNDIKLFKAIKKQCLIKNRYAKYNDFKWSGSRKTSKSCYYFIDDVSVELVE